MCVCGSVCVWVWILLNSSSASYFSLIYPTVSPVSPLIFISKIFSVMTSIFAAVELIFSDLPPFAPLVDGLPPGGRGRSHWSKFATTHGPRMISLVKIHSHPQAADNLIGQNSPPLSSAGSTQNNS